MTKRNGNETIAALSTPPGESGIAVIRLCGGDALSILSSIFRTSRGRKPAPHWEHRRLYHGTVVGAEREVIDDVMCAVMRAPESYTGEDTVEISCHGNTLLVRRILDLAYANGARPAEPGEFTKRAFLNGKIDLIQAEAVGDLIHAKSELQRQVARAQLSGNLSKRIHGLADGMLELLGIIEANIDFIEEGIETLDFEGSIVLLDRHRRELDDLLSGAELSRPFRDGYRVAIAGPVNAGKSSLFNQLIGEERAIVTEVPGTTRDVLREPIVLRGLLFVMQDTAGLRGSADRVESIGIGLAVTAADAADLVLFVLDAAEPMPEVAACRLRELDPARTIVVLNKIDLPARMTAGDVRAIQRAIRVAPVSARTGEGLGELKDALVERVGLEHLNWIARERVVLNSRLIHLLGNARAQLETLLRNFEARAPLEILALDAREVLGVYETATGRRYTDDLLDTIFTRFCIGK